MVALSVVALWTTTGAHLKEAKETLALSTLGMPARTDGSSSPGSPTHFFSRPLVPLVA